MRGIIKVPLLISAITYILLNFSGCATITLKPKFAALGEMPPEALRVVNPAQVEVMTGEPPIDKEYIDLGCITVDEKWTSPIMTMSISEKDIIEMVRTEAADHGADAVIKFSITGKHPARKAKGIAIVYRK